MGEQIDLSLKVDWCLLYVSAMKLLSWNVRGLGKPVKRRKIKNLFFERKVDMVLLQETKKQNSEWGVCQINLAWGKDGFHGSRFNGSN